MPEYLSPGVYVEEVDTGSKPIEGVSTSTSAMVGVTERGPVNVPIMVTSVGEYARLFGGRLNPNFYAAPHHFLPHAVEGFFNNEGQRLYVVRVLDTDAALKSSLMLYDRGEADSAETVLLRAIDAGTGTAGSPPGVYAVDGADVAPGDWIRAGDGSRAEYRQVATVAGTEHVALDLPLLRAHDAGATVDDVTRSVIENFVLDGELEAEDDTIRVHHEDADPAVAAAAIQALVDGTAAGVLLEIGPGAASRREYRFAIAGTVDAADPTRADLQLDEPLVLGHADTDPVTSIGPAPDIENAFLETAAVPGNSVVFLDDTAGDYDVGRLVIFDAAEDDLREVRRVGELGELTLAAPAYEDYPVNGLVQSVTLADDDDGTARVLDADPALADTTITLDDVSDILAGHVLRVGAAGTQEDVIVDSVADPVVTLTAPLRIDHGLGDPVVRLNAFVLTADVADGSRVLELSGRIDVNTGGSLTQGQLLRIGDAADDEYIFVDELTSPDASQYPDAGQVVLQAGVRRGHAEGTFVYVQAEPGLAAVGATTTVFASDEDADSIWVSETTGYAADQWVRITTPRGEAFVHRITAVGGHAVRRIEVDTTPFARPHIRGAALVERAALIEVEAIDAGIWGDRLRISVEDEEDGLVQGTTLQDANVTSSTEIRLDSALGVEAGTVLEFSDGEDVVGDLVTVDGIDRRTGSIQLADPGLDADQLAELGANGSLQVSSREFRVTVRLLRQPDPAVPSRNTTVMDTEEFRYLSMDPRHSQYFQDVIGEIDGELRLWDRRPEGQSMYIRVRDLNPVQTPRLGPEPLEDTLPSGQAEAARLQLTGGDDSLGTLSFTDHYVGSDNSEPELRTGIQSLRNEDDASIVACPGQTNEDVQRGLIEHCESMRYRFAVLDGPEPDGDTLADVQAHRQRYDSKYAALYHPWLRISDPYPRTLMEERTIGIPPSGHMMGVYARTDVQRGVHKAPANEVVRGIRGLNRKINKREHDLLNPRNINVIRDFRDNNRGIRAWGARVITSDSSWKYVNVRRLLIYIEHSIERGTQWVVFEPNADPLWARVRRTIRNFLTVVWRDGALEGTSVEEAFFVRCDRTTMTQTDIDNGRLICEIGVAPVKPAEFVIFRIGLWTAHAEE